MSLTDWDSCGLAYFVSIEWCNHVISLQSPKDSGSWGPYMPCACLVNWEIQLRLFLPVFEPYQYWKILRSVIFLPNLSSHVSSVAFFDCHYPNSWTKLVHQCRCVIQYASVHAPHSEDEKINISIINADEFESLVSETKRCSKGSSLPVCILGVNLSYSDHGSDWDHRLGPPSSTLPSTWIVHLSQHDKCCIQKCVATGYQEDRDWLDQHAPYHPKSKTRLLSLSILQRWVGTVSQIHSQIWASSQKHPDPAKNLHYWRALQ